MINIFYDGHEWEVWHDVEDLPKDGVCIGTGLSQMSALVDAKTTLEGELLAVNGHIEPLIAAMLNKAKAV